MARRVLPIVTCVCGGHGKEYQPCWLCRKDMARKAGYAISPIIGGCVEWNEQKGRWVSVQCPTDEGTR